MYLLSRDDNSSECNEDNEPEATVEDLGGTLSSTAKGILAAGCY